MAMYVNATSGTVQGKPFGRVVLLFDNPGDADDFVEGLEEYPGRVEVSHEADEEQWAKDAGF